MRLFYLINWHFLVRRKLQSLLCIFGIATGVAVVVSVDAANVSALQSFREGVDVVAGKATHQVVPVTGPDLDERVIVPLINSGVKAAPVIEQFVALADQPGETLRILAIDPLMERPFRSYTTSGTDGSETKPSWDLSAMLTEPGLVLLSQQFAQRHNLKPGQTLQVIIGTSRKALTIHGTFVDEKLGSGSENIALMDIGAAQELFGKSGRLDRIDVITAQSDASSLQNMIGESAVLQRSGTRTQRIEQMVRSFQMNLFALSLLAVFVGTFLIYNTLTFSVIQRRRHIGVLRCLGLTRAQVGGLFLLEAVVLGIVGSAIGLAAGLLLAGYTVGAVTGTINTLYTALALPELHLTAATAWKALALGVGGSLSAAMVPAFEAITVAPAAAVARSFVDIKMRRRAPTFAVAGLLILLLSLGLSLLPSKSTVPGYLSAFAMVTGFGFLCPLITLWLVKLLSALLKSQVVALLGVRNISGSLSRTSPAIAALMVSLAMVIGVNLMVRSFRDSVIQWIDQTLRADIYIQPAGRPAQRDEAFLPPEVIRQLRAHPDVTDVDLLRHQQVQVHNVTANLAAVEFSVLSKHSNYQFVEGSQDDAYRRTAREGTVIISETLRSRTNLRAGERVNIPTPSGLVPFEIAGVYRDYSTDGGTILMDRATYRAAWSDDRVNNAALYTRDGASPEKIIASLQSNLRTNYQLMMRSNKSLKTEVLRIFDKTFAITYVLQFLAMIVAVCGIVSALLALLLERTRELATLRSLGMTARQLLAMLYVESASIGLIASAVGLVAGVSLSLVLIYVINVRSFGWTIQFQIYPGVLITAAILAITAALAAAIYPARRLKGINLAAALREE
jgi:putative ABC transport system permease protein